LSGGESSPRHPTGNGETAGFEGQGHASPRARGGGSDVNDVKDAIDRIGQRFDPPPDGLARLTRRRHRVDTRRRITAGALALTVGVGGSILAARAFLGSSTGHANRVRIVTVPAASGASPTPATVGGPPCPRPSGDSPP